MKLKVMKIPVSDMLDSPDAPIPNQIAEWREDFLNRMFYVKATEVLPIMIAGRSFMDGEDTMFIGMLSTKDEVPTCVEHLLDNGAMWVSSIMEAHFYTVDDGGNKNPGTKQECLIFASYADSWQEMAIQPFSREFGDRGLPFPSGVLQIHSSGTDGPILGGALVPFQAKQENN